MAYTHTVNRLAEAIIYLGVAVKTEQHVRQKVRQSPEYEQWVNHNVVAGERDMLPALICHEWPDRNIELSDGDRIDLSDAGLTKRLEQDLELAGEFWMTVRDCITKGTLALTRNLRDLYAVEITILDEIVEHIAATRAQSPRTRFAFAE